MNDLQRTEALYRQLGVALRRTQQDGDWLQGDKPLKGRYWVLRIHPGQDFIVGGRHAYTCLVFDLAGNFIHQEIHGG